MIIGVCLNFNNMPAFEEQVPIMAKEGFTTCQIIAGVPRVWTEENFNRVKELLNEYKITPSAFWCGWDGPSLWNFYEGPKTIGLVPREYREMRIKNLCDGADFAKGLGIRDVITHMGFIPENPNDTEFIPICDAIRTVAEHLKKNGQNLLFETGQETPVTLLRCFEVVGTDNLGVNLDTANLILYGKANTVDAVEILGKYIMNLHAKDGFYPTNGRELGKQTRIGDGQVDFKGVITKLHALGYDSHITIEREIKGEQQIEDIRFAKKYLQDIIDEVCR
jgi:sugar phosphate isomerase/epimerase